MTVKIIKQCTTCDLSLGPTMRGDNGENNENIIISNEPRDRIVSKSKILPWYKDLAKP